MCVRLRLCDMKAERRAHARAGSADAVRNTVAGDRARIRRAATANRRKPKVSAPE